MTEEEDLPDYIIADGRQGFNSGMNGVYQKSTELHEGKNYWKKSGSDWTIRWYPKSNQWLFDRKGLRVNDRASARVCENVAHPGLVTKCWRVYNNDKIVKDPNILVKSYSTQNLPCPKYLIVCGRVGFNEEINGLYERSDKLYKGRHYYKKHGSNWTIRWYPLKGQWIFDRKHLRDSDRGCGRVTQDVLHPGLVTKKWKIYDGKHTIEDPKCRVIPLDEHELNSSCPQKIIVSGRAGFNQDINGKYEKSRSLHQGRYYYQKTATNWLLRWYPPKYQWIFDRKGLRDSDRGCARVTQDVIHPGLVTKVWRVFNNADTVEDPKVQVIGQGELTFEPEPEESSEGEKAVSDLEGGIMDLVKKCFKEEISDMFSSSYQKALPSLPSIQNFMICQNQNTSSMHDIVQGDEEGVHENDLFEGCLVTISMKGSPVDGLEGVVIRCNEPNKGDYEVHLPNEEVKVFQSHQVVEVFPKTQIKEVIE